MQNQYCLKVGILNALTKSNDVLILPQEIEIFSAPRIQSRNTHGTGCTLSSAIASYLAQGYPLMSAVQLAKHYITRQLSMPISSISGMVMVLLIISLHYVPNNEQPLLLIAYFDEISLIYQYDK